MGGMQIPLTIYVCKRAHSPISVTTQPGNAFFSAQFLSFHLAKASIEPVLICVLRQHTLTLTVKNALNIVLDNSMILMLTNQIEPASNSVPTLFMVTPSLMFA